MSVVINVKDPGSKGALSIYGGCLEFMNSKDHQVFLYGGTGTGKTTTGTLKMVLLCLLYPGVKFLFTRKSYRSLIKSGVETLERVIREVGLEIGKKPSQIKKLGETEPREYVFPHQKVTKLVDGKERVFEGKSRIVLSSLDRVYDEMGAEYDYVYVNQPEQITEQDWQFLSTRATGRRGVAPYPQLFGDPNPEHERHWIKTGGYELIDGVQVPETGRWRLIKSTYRDNPVIWDMKNECFTEEGEKQIGRLASSLSPVMKLRLLESEWASFEGLVYGEVWKRSEHLKTPAEFEKIYGPIDDRWERYWAIDFGLVDPFVCSMYAKHPERELYIRYKSVYMTDKTINDHAETIKNFTIGEPKPKLIVADRNPESIRILSQALGLNIVTATKGAGSIKSGINVITEMLNKNELIFLTDSVVEEDMELRALRKPIGFEEEIDNYRWDINRKTTNEEPIDKDNHELDAARYLFCHIKANQKKVKFIWI